MTESTPTHDPIQARLSEYLDRALDRREAEAIEAHLAGCEPCRTVLDGLARVRARAGALEDRGPERDLWPGILGGLDRARVIDLADHLGSERHATPRMRPSRRGVFLSLPQLGAAAAALVILAAGGAWGVARSSASVAEGLDAASDGRGVVRPVALPESATGPGADFSESTAEVAELEAALQGGRDRLDPNTIRILEKNLALIDGAIRESVEALAIDPGNPFVEQHLQRSWERKVTYLREAAALLDLSD